jgi:hypothetical protein
MFKGALQWNYIHLQLLQKQTKSNKNNNTQICLHLQNIKIPNYLSKSLKLSWSYKFKKNVHQE